MLATDITEIRMKAIFLLFFMSILPRLHEIDEKVYMLLKAGIVTQVRARQT
jgi:hypothetical protein